MNFAVARQKNPRDRGRLARIFCIGLLPGFAAPAWLDQAVAAEVTNVSTPSGATHGSLVSGNIPCANGPAGLNDCGKTAPGGQLVGTSDSQTLTNKTISGAQNTLSNVPDSALSANVDLLNGAQTLTGLKTFSGGATFSTGTVTMPGGGTFTSTGNTLNKLTTFSGGLVLPSPTNPTGSNFFLDSNGSLNIVNANGTFPTFGGCFSGDCTRPWLKNAFGVGLQESSSNGTPLFACQRNEFYNGGSTASFCINAINTVGNGFTTTTTADAAIGATTLTVVPKSSITAGQPVSGGGVTAGTTVSSYSAGTLVLSQGLTIAQPAGLTLAFESGSNIAPTNKSTTIQAQLADFGNESSTKTTGVPLDGFSFKYFPGARIEFGGVFGTTDFTGRKSSVAGPLAAVEIDTSGSGPDDGLSRVGLDLPMAETVPSADGPTTFGYDYRCRPQTSLSSDIVNPVTIIDCFVASTMSGNAGEFGNIANGFRCDGGDTHCFAATSDSFAILTSAIANSGQAVLVFALGSNVNPGQRVTGSASIPANTTVLSVLQCMPTNPATGCINPNETEVALSSNLTGSIALGASLTFTGVHGDGSYFYGYFTDAFTNWTNQGAGGLIKAGTLLNSGTVLDIQGFGTDSTQTPGVAYGDIHFDVQSNTHGSAAGNINLVPAGAGCVKISGTCTGTAATQNTGTSGGTLPFLNGANTWSGVQTYGSDDFVLTGAVSGDIGTFNSSHALRDSGTLLSSLAPLASPTFTGTLTAAAMIATGNLTSQAHVISNGTALGCGDLSFGTGAGTSPTCTSVTGDDRHFTVNYTSGTSPAAAAAIFTLTFKSAYGAAPNCAVFQASANAATFIGRTYVTSTTTTAVLNANGSAIQASTAYTYNFQCIQ